MLTNTKYGVYVHVSQDIWYNTRILIAELQDVESNEIYWVYMDMMWFIRVVLVDVDSKYRDKNPCLKVLYLTLYSWQPFRDKEGWWIS